MLDNVHSYPLKADPKVCRVPVCDRNTIASGYCRPHYEKRRKFGYVPNLPVEKFNAPGSRGVCSVGECEKLHHALGLCVNHYMVYRRRRMQGRA